MPAAPPAISPNISAVVDPFIKNVVEAAPSIKASYFTNFKGKTVGPIRQENIMDYYDKVWCPNRKQWEGTWADDPVDKGGPTMVGVTWSTLGGSFDKLFGNVPGAQAVKATGFITKRDIGCQVLYKMLSVTEIQDIFMYKFYGSLDGGSANMIASVDPWLSLITVGSYWGSGGGYYNKGFSSIAKKYGYTGDRQGFGPWVASWKLTDPATDVPKLVNFAVEVFVSRVNFMLAISAPGLPNNKFRKGWLKGMIPGDTNRDSKLQLLVRSMDYFTEAATLGKLNQAEINHLTLLKACYEKVNFVFPDY